MFAGALIRPESALGLGKGGKLFGRHADDKQEA
jgi:hypothetical protein